MSFQPGLLFHLAFLVAIACFPPALTIAQEQEKNPFDVPEPVLREPTVSAVVSSDPQTGPALMKAIAILLDVDRKDLAQSYLEKLNALELSDEQWFDLYRSSGPDAVFRLAILPELQPMGGDVSRKILDAAERFATDASRIDGLIQQLFDDDKYVRSTALANLRLLGDFGAASLINLLADPSHRDHWARVRTALRYFGNSAEEPLLAALRSNDPKLQAEAAMALGYVPTSGSLESLYVLGLWDGTDPLIQRVAARSLIRLTGRVPTVNEVETRLYRSAHDYLMDRIVISRNESDQVKWWRWDANEQVLKMNWMRAETVARIRAFRRARDLVRLQPDREDYQRLFWLTRLESAKLTSGRDQPLPESLAERLAESVDSDMVLQVLDEALRLNRAPAAIGACEILQRVGHQGTLAGSAHAPSPLVAALDYGNVRLTHAATQAIAKIDPVESFMGCSRYIAALARLARSTGERKVLVGHLNTEIARSIGAAVGQAGYTPVVATRSKEIFDLVASDPDIELLVLTDVVDQPDFVELLQLIQGRGTSQRLPVLLMVRAENLPRAQRQAQRWPHVTASQLIFDPSLLARQVSNTVPQDQGGSSSGFERVKFAAAALAQLVKLAEQPERYPFFDLVSQEETASVALNTPALSDGACRLLGRIGTTSAQQNLLSVVNNDQLPPDLRLVAAESFARAIAARGLMLTRTQILAQYDLYNATAENSPDSQRILGFLLDAMEKKGK